MMPSFKPCQPKTSSTRCKHVFLLPDVDAAIELTMRSRFNPGMLSYRLLYPGSRY
jgi:hypothetical protein